MRELSHTPMFQLVGLLIAWRIFPVIVGPLFGLILRAVHPSLDLLVRIRSRVSSRIGLDSSADPDIPTCRTLDIALVASRFGQPEACGESDRVDQQADRRGGVRHLLARR